MTITLPDEVSTGETIAASWGTAVRTALSDLDTNKIDVTIDTVSDGEIIVYVTDHWENQTIAEAGLMPLSGGTFTGDVTIGTHSMIYDSGDYLYFDTTNNVLYLLIGNQTSLTIGGSGSNFCTLVGHYAGHTNFGSYVDVVGVSAAWTNEGNYVSGVGTCVAEYNKGDNVAAVGEDAAQFNTGNEISAIGKSASRYNVGNYSQGIGTNALLYNGANDNVAIGHNAFSTFVEDSGNAKNIVSVDSNNQMTVTAHGFGSVGDFILLKISTTGTLPSGLDAGVDVWEVVDADTLECISDWFAAGSGSGTHTLTPQTVYTNSTAIGHDAEPTASNQVMLGDSNVTEVKSAGAMHFNGGTLTSDLTMSGGDVVLGTQSIGYDNTGGLTFDSSNNASFSGELTVTGAKITFDTDDYLEYDTANDVIYGYISGSQSLAINIGTGCNFLGKYAGSSNSGTYSNGFGHSSLQNNSGDSSNGFGAYSLRYNDGDYSNGFGHSSLQYNSGTYSNGFGYGSLQYNSGNDSNGFGFYSLRNNSGHYSNGFGHYSLQYNSGDSSNGFGYSSLQYNDGDDNTAIGHNSFSTFVEDSGNAKNIESVNASENQVTITGHGWGSAGDRRILKASTTDTLPAGLSTDPHIWEVVDANTLECVTDSFTDAGTGTHTLTPQYIYTNSTAIGYNAEPTASNQVMLGDSNVTEVKSAGKGSFAGADLNDNPLQNLKRYDQNDEPTLSSNGDMALWYDADGATLYLVVKDEDAGQVKLAFS